MATTRTLPVSGGTLTKPALTDTADISVISTDLENIYQEFVSQNNNFKNFIHGGIIADGTDLNTVTDPGVYLLSTSFTFQNYTPQVTNILIVLKASATGTTVLQIAYGTPSAYYRFRTTSTSWQPRWMNLTTGHGWQAKGTNIDELVTPGNYFLSSSNAPFAGSWPSGVTGAVFIEVIAADESGTYAIQRMSSFTETAEYKRYRGTDSGTGWTSWVQLRA